MKTVMSTVAAVVAAVEPSSVGAAAAGTKTTSRSHVGSLCCCHRSRLRRRGKRHNCLLGHRLVALRRFDRHRPSAASVGVVASSAQDCAAPVEPAVPEVHSCYCCWPLGTVAAAVVVGIVVVAGVEQNLLLNIIEAHNQSVSRNGTLI